MGAFKELAIKIMHGETLSADEKAFLKDNCKGKAIIGTETPEQQLELFLSPQDTETPETQEAMNKESNEKWLETMEADADWIEKEEMLRHGHLQAGDL